MNFPRSYGNFHSTDKPTPQPEIVPVALRLAAGQMNAFCTRGKLDEEVLTNAMFGIFFNTMSFLVSLAGADPSALPACKWGSYRKYRSSEVKETERYSGADFAFLIADGDDYARLAIFQAKRGYRDDPDDPMGHIFIDVHQRPKSDDANQLRETQMLRMARLGSRLDALSLGRNLATSHRPPSINPLEWIHYLAYLEDSVVCVALNQLQPEYKIEIGDTSKANPVDLNDPNRKIAVSFSEVLRHSSIAGSSPWLRIKADQLIGELPTLTDLMPIVVADERGAFAPKVEHKLGAQLVYGASDLALKPFLTELRTFLEACGPRFNPPTPRG